MSSTREPFEPECWYHIYNHARGNDKLFDSDYDNRTFLELIKKYIVPVAEIYAYCLMSNHFHFLIRFKDVKPINSFRNRNIGDYLSHQWGNVQNTYSKKKNYRSGKRGGLFCQSINRNLIDSEDYLKLCVVYIHNNPVHHGYCATPDQWRFSSYNTILSPKESEINKEEVTSWFSDKENFIQFHQSNAADIFAEKYKLH